MMHEIDVSKTKVLLSDGGEPAMRIPPGVNPGEQETTPRTMPDRIWHIAVAQMEPRAIVGNSLWRSG